MEENLCKQEAVEENETKSMRHSKNTDYETACCEIIDVLEKHEITIGSLDRLLTYVKEMVYFNTPIQNSKEN